MADEFRATRDSGDPHDERRRTGSGATPFGVRPGVRLAEGQDQPRSWSTPAVDWLAWASIAVPACARMFVRE